MQHPPGFTPSSVSPLGHGESWRPGAPLVIHETARAKVNLTLLVKGKRADGYHELESLVAFADVCDELSFTPSSTDSLQMDGPFAGAVDRDNLVFKAKSAVAEWFRTDIRGEFRLRKAIPVAAGLGGGSSDAAAAIRALARLHGRSGEIEAFAPKAASIGADVPVCLHHRAAWMCGLGERVTPIAPIAPLPAVLVNPRIKLSTAAVFKALDAPPFASSHDKHEPAFATDWKDPEGAAATLRQGRNDLERPAVELEPAVASVLDAFTQVPGCLLARLSGSGPTCFGIFRDREMAEAASAQLARRHPGWWIAQTVLA